ncbi:hypothetical protein BJX99DRAFT_271856 [Aspergillus californicus]
MSISFNRNPLHQANSRTPETPPSSIFDSAGYGNSPNETWSDSSSSSSEALMPYHHQQHQNHHHQPWVVEPAMNYSLIPPPHLQSPIEPLPDGLPRIVPSMSMGGGSSEWLTPLFSSNYSPLSRQLKPETRRLLTGKPPSDWVHAPGSGSRLSEPLYRASHFVGTGVGIGVSAGAHYLPPHSSHSSLSSSSSTNPTPTTGLSPTSANMPCHSPPLSLVSPPIKLEMDREDGPTVVHMEEAEDSSADPPYSQLIYEALLAAPGKKLPLQGIYLWFETNTAKGRDRTSKGWQNSIRHNLSMNAGFEAVRQDSTPGKKAVNFWRLTDEAVNNGIQSTTRYRKQTNYKKSVASDPPAPQRQRSGAKGGKATKVTARFRSSGPGSMGMTSQDDYRRERERERVYRQQQHQLHLHLQQQHQHQRVIPSQRQLPKAFIYNQYIHHQPSTTTTATSTSAASIGLTGTTTAMPSAQSPVYTPGGCSRGGSSVGATPTTTAPVQAATTRTATTTLTTTTRPPINTFDLGPIVGCADAPPCTAPAPTSIFCDMAGSGPDCLVFDTGFMGWDGLHSSFAATAAAEIATADLHMGM